MSETAQPLIDVQLRLIRRACDQLAQDAPPSLAALAGQAGLSTHQFHRLFKAIMGITPKAYAQALRQRRAQRAVACAPSVTDAIYEAGFQSSGRFYEQAQDMLGMTPTQYRQGASGLRIRFGIAQCSLGAILVAATDLGVCEISIGDTPEPLLAALQQRFSHAELIGADAPFEAWMAQIVGLVENPGMPTDLPLDIRGTAFQRRVWQALREIGPGQSASYTDVAKRLGSPSAVRAVASACAANPIALLIPCHRVVRIDGSPAGYRWGVERKLILRSREAAALRSATVA